MDAVPPQLPLTPPAYVAPAPVSPECRYLNNAEAQAAFKRLKAALPGTSFEGAAPSEVCGLVKVKLSRGNTVYTDSSGRFFIIGMALDTTKGEPADRSAKLEQIFEDRETFPTAADGLNHPFPNQTTSSIQ